MADLEQQALSALKLEGRITKEKARESLFSQPLKTVTDAAKRDRAILEQLFLQNPLALDVKTQSEKYEPAQDRHTLDVLTFIFAASEPEVQEMLAQVLINSAKAIPLVIPFAKPRIGLWPIKNISKSWQEGLGVYSERRVYDLETPIVSFIKIGEKNKISKSMFINKAFFDKNFQVFTDYRTTYGQQPLTAGRGMIDMAWRGPQFDEEDLEKSDLATLITIFNLHGDALEQKMLLQLKLVFKYSAVVVVFAQTLNLIETALQETTYSGQSILVVTEFQEQKKYNEQKTEFEYYKNKLQEKLKGRKIEFFPIRQEVIGDTFYEQIKGRVSDLLNQKPKLAKQVSLKKIGEEIAIDPNWEVDLNSEELQQPIKKAEEIFNLLIEVKTAERSLGSCKSEILKLQRKEFSNLFVNCTKNLLRSKESGEEIKNKMEETKSLMAKERINPIVEKFVEYLQQNIDQKKQRASMLFLDHLAQKLDQQSFVEMTELRKIYSNKIKDITAIERSTDKNNEKHEELKQLKIEEKQLTQQINEESFGLEHIFRELSLIWTFADERKRKQYSHYPKLCAEQLMNGSSIELMDGDTSFIFCDWIENLLQEVGVILEERYEAKKGFVTSIMGLQSSGKSTLLNIQYNVRFAVAAGRCTKGIFMLPVILNQELRKEFNVDFMLLFDTEGLRAQELGINEENRSKDAEMATACIGVADATCINSMNFQNSELFEILGIVTNMIVRYKRDNQREPDAFNVSSVFINQGISDSHHKAIDLGITVRQNDLNEMTQQALMRIGIPQEKAERYSFIEIIKRTLQEQFIDPLFIDDGDTRRYSYEYVQKVHSLRLLSLAVLSSSAREMKKIIKKIVVVYGAILQDDFAFVFRNDEELASKNLVYKKSRQFQIELSQEIYEYSQQEEKKENNGDMKPKQNRKILINNVTQQKLKECLNKLDEWEKKVSQDQKGILKFTTKFKKDLKDIFELKLNEENIKLENQGKKEKIIEKIDKVLDALKEADGNFSTFWNKDKIFEAWFEETFSEFYEQDKQIYIQNIDLAEKSAVTFKAHFRNDSSAGLPNYLKLKEDKIKEETKYKKSQSKSTLENKEQLTDKLTNIEDQFPAQFNFLKSERDKAIQEDEMKKMIDEQRKEFSRLVEQKLNKLFQEQAACQEYNSASFGLWITKADQLIDDIIAQDQAWQIVPADFYKPMMIDKFSNMLFNLYKPQEELSLISKSPDIYLNQIVKPEQKEEHINWRMNDMQANLQAEFFFSQIQTQFEDYIIKNKVKKMIGILEQVDGSVNKKNKILFPQTKDQMLNRFIEQMNAISQDMEESKFAQESKVNENKIKLLTSFLTNFDNYCDQSFFEVLKKYIDEEQKKELVQKMLKEFIDNWNDILHFAGKVGAGCEISFEDPKQQDKDDWRTKCQTSFKEIFDDLGDKVTRTMFVEYIELMIKGEQKIQNQARKYKGLMINNDNLGEFCDFEIRYIGEHFKKEKMGCTKQCPLCGAICKENSNADHSLHNTAPHFFPGLLGTFIYIQTVENDVAKQHKLLIDDKTCMQMAFWMKDIERKGFNGWKDWLNTNSTGVKFLCSDNEIGSFSDVYEKKYKWRLSESQSMSANNIKMILESNKELLLRHYQCDGWTSKFVQDQEKKEQLAFAKAQKKKEDDRIAALAEAKAEEQKSDQT